MPLSVMIEQSGQELIRTLRGFRGSPGFFAAAILLIAVGIGAVTTVFALVNALLLRPLPVRNPGNLVQVVQLLPPNFRPLGYFSYELYRSLAEGSSTLYEVMGQNETTVALDRGGDPERIYVQAVTDNFFSGIGVNAALGRVFGPGDDHVAVLSHDGWSRYFHRDPAVIGRGVRLGGHSFQIIGVTPEGFNGTIPDISPALRFPYRYLAELSDSDRARFLEIIARLKPGLSLEQARQEVISFWKPLPEAAQSAAFDSRLEVRSIERGASYLREQFRTALLVVMGGSGLLLLMVCSNVGALLLARSTARAKETAVQLALGASRMRIVRQCLIESFLLAGIGGTAGLLLARAGMALLTRWTPQLPLSSWDLRTFVVDIRPDLRIIAFSIAACSIVLVLAALAPAWRSSRSDPYTELKVTMSDIRHQRLQGLLCGLQVAMCTVLVISAALMARTLATLHAIDPGFDSEHVATFSIDPLIGSYTREQTWSLQQRLLREARLLPDVEAAGIAGMPLMRGIGIITTVAMPGEKGQRTDVNSVTPGYFDAMNMRFLAGRQFHENDKPDAAPAPVVVNEAFVRTFFGGRNPVGQRFGFAAQREIIGIVSDSHYRSLRETPPPILYISAFGPKASVSPFVLHIRTRGSPEAIFGPIRKLLQSIDPRIPIFQASTLSDEIERSLWRERVIMSLAGAFAVFALLLSGIGLYGALAYFVTRRRREIGLRLALGARAVHVGWIVTRRMGPMMFAGMICGVALYLAAGVWIRSLLFGVELADPVSIMAAAGLLLAVAGCAAAVPVFRALHVDPAAMLKQE